MNILICNWRDIRNPHAGGAEQLTQEMAARWVKKGHDVSQISAGFPGCTPEEVIDGVHIVRRGSWWNVSLFACIYYFVCLKRNVDVVIDEVHWFPYFTKLYVPEKTVLLACEVANRRFFTLFPYPVALFWRLMELMYLRVYRDVPTMAISPSTKSELVSHGFPRKNITVLPMGLTIPSSLSPHSKEKIPTIIFLGRLNALKGANDAIDVLNLVKRTVPSAVLWFVGSGDADFITRMRSRINTYGISDSVIFHGFVSEKKKYELLSRAHVLIVPSVHEGWGLIVSEAAYVGTPAVVYDVPGLRDGVSDKQTGFITPPHPNAMAKRTEELLTNHFVYRGMQHHARTYARGLTWDATASAGLCFLEAATVDRSLLRR